LARTLLKGTPAASDQFGYAVAAVGNNLLVGVPHDGAFAANAGAAYLFDGTTGALLQTFHSPSAAGGDQFGAAVAGGGNLVVIGAPGDDNGVANAGAAYVFNATTGALIARLQKPTPAAGSQFGAAVAVVGSNVVVGAYADNAGAAYLFDAATGALVRELQDP